MGGLLALGLLAGRLLQAHGGRVDEGGSLELQLQGIDGLKGLGIPGLALDRELFAISGLPGLDELNAIGNP